MHMTAGITRSFKPVRTTGLIFILIVVAALLAGIMSCTSQQVQSSSMTSERFSFYYNVDTGAIPARAQRLDMYLPLAQTSAYQEVSDYVVSSDLEHEVISDPIYGNKILHLWGDNPPESLSPVEVRLEVTRHAADGPSLQGPQRTASLETFLRPNSLVPIDGVIADEAASIMDKEFSVLENVRAIYDHLWETMSYDKSGDGWGRGDALYACDVRTGNCTDIHSLFIGMLRSQGIPARFIMGFPLPKDEQTGQIAGYHCWAEFYLPDRGWLPVDLSEAIKHPKRKDFFFGHLDANRVAFTLGRDIRIGSPIDSQRLNYFVYPFVLIDGAMWEGAKTRFSFERAGV